MWIQTPFLRADRRAGAERVPSRHEESPVGTCQRSLPGAEHSGGPLGSLGPLGLCG